MSVSNINSGIHGRGRASPRKVCDENKKKKPRLRKNFFDDRKDFVWLMLKLDVINVDEHSQWLVLRIGGDDFLHCWVTNSI